MNTQLNNSDIKEILKQFAEEMAKLKQQRERSK